MALTPAQAEFYGHLENMFLTPGWALLTQGWTAERDSLPEDAFFNAKSPEDLRAYRVRYNMLDELIKLPDMIATQKENVIEGQSQDNV